MKRTYGNKIEVHKVTAFLIAFLMMLSLFNFPITAEAKTVEQFSAENNGATYAGTFYGHYGGALDNTWSSKADGGTTSNGKYINAVNRYLDSGRVFKFDGSYHVEIQVGAYAGTYNIYVGSSNQSWYKIGTVTLGSYTWGSVVVNGNNLPIKDIRYYRVEKATASAKAVDHIRAYVRRTDDNPPTYTSTSITDISEAGYTVHVYGVSDAVTGVNRVSMPTWTSAGGQDDLVWYGATNHGGGHWSYTVKRSNHKNEYGEYNTHIYMYDNYDNASSVSLATVVPDKTNPTISLSYSPSGWTKGNVAISYSATDNAGGTGIKRTLLPNGNYNNDASNTYTVSSNGTYKFTTYDQYDNSASKSVTISNIDKTAPTLTLNQNTTGYTNSSVVITATGSDSQSGVKRIKDPAGNWTTGASDTYTVSANGTYEFTIEDNVGNTATKSITVGNIDKTNPTVTLTPNTTAWTNGNVTITAKASDNLAGIKSITKPDSTVVEATSTTYVASSNASYSFSALDNAGNKGSNSISIGNIDKTNPTATLTPDTTAWTKGNVIIAFSTADSQSGVKQVKYPNGNVVTSTSGNYAVSSNGSYNFEITDVAGNVLTKSITISNIDKTAPGLTLAQSPTANTAGNVVITATGSDSGSGVKRILLPSGSWVSTTGSTTYTVTGNGTFSFTVEDNSGNQTVKTITVSNIDKTAPVLTLSQGTSGWTNGNVTITATATDNLAGVSSIEKPDGTVASASSTTYVVSSNGTYTFKSTDSVGNVSSKSITVSNIDKTKPTATLTPDTTAWTKNNVNISFSTDDTQSGVKQVKYPNGTVVTASTGSYTVSANGTYSFDITDNAGNVLTKSISITNIDKANPSLAFSLSPSANTTKNVVITATGSDVGSGVKRIKKPDGTWAENTSSVTYTVSENGSYSFTVEDNIGNQATSSVNVNNIDRTSPVLTLTPSTSSWTNNNITITATATDNLAGVSSIEKPDGTVASGSSTSYVVSANGTYTFKSTDKVGNVTSKSITISNIDKTNPTATLTPNTTAWTKNDVTIAFSTSDANSGVKQVKYPNGTVVTEKSGSYTVNANGTYEFEITDVAGNVIKKSITISNIDKSAPGLTLSQSPTTNTSSDVVITATGSDSGSGVKRILLPNGSWVTTSSSASYTTKVNGSFSFTVEDNAGNQTVKTISVGNIDKNAPELTLTASSSSWTNGDVTITASAKDNFVGVASIELPNGTVVNGSTATYVVTANGTYTFKSTDLVGNVASKTITISNIDKTKPAVTLTPDTTAWTKNNVTITFNASDANSGLKQVKYPNGTIVNVATGSYAVSVNGTYSFDITDNAGNVLTKSITVSNIDKTAPGLTLSQSPTANTSSDVVITAIGSDTGSGVKRILLPSGSWVTTSSSASYTTKVNGSFSFTVEDNAGNQTVKTISVGNIDKSAPELTLTASSTSWTNGDVTITASSKDNFVGVASIELPNGTVFNGSNTTYVVSANGTYTFKSTDLVGNVATKSITISNIDKAKPTIAFTKTPSTWTGGDVSITATATDSLSGVKQIKLPNGSIVNGSSASYTVASNGSLSFEIMDLAGNVLVQSVSVDNIDKTSPTGTVTQNPTSWTNGGVTLTVSAQDSGSGIKSIKKPDGTVVNSSTATHIVNVNGNNSFIITDNAGNTTTKTITVSNIDTVLPTVTITKNVTSWTNGNVVLTGSATDNASSVVSMIKPDGNSVSGNSATYTVTENGSFSFKAVDGAGNVGTGTISVDNIDKGLPSLNLTASTTSWIKGSVTITAVGTDSVSGVKEIKLPNGSIVTGGNTSYIVTANNTYSFEARDNANNVITKTITVSNIDTTAPSVTLTPSTTAYTKGDLSITVASSDSQSGVKEIKLPNGSIVQGSSATYTVSANGTYSFEVFDKVGNKTTKNITISNIDKVAPVLTLSLGSDRITNQTVTINAVGYDAISGVKSIKLPNGSVVSGASASYTVQSNGRYDFEIEDVAGNKSISTIEVSNIITINPVSGIQKIEYRLEGAVTKDWTVYTGQFNVEAEGITTVKARAIDKAGNISNEAVSFVKIDRSKPINGTVEIIVR